MKQFNILPGMLLFFFIITTQGLRAEESSASFAKRDTLLSVARQNMQSIRYCALVTVDSLGQPHVRMMDPFPPDENMIVWLGTNRRSRKAGEIRNNPRVALYYSDNGGSGYVVVSGRASLVDDAKEKAARWKEEWARFYQDQRENYLLIKIIPERIEVVDYAHGIVGDSETWGAPFVEFKAKD